MEKPVTLLLEKWPDRRAVLDDARAAEPDLDLVAVHRWFQRGSVPSKHWGALLAGAKRRRLGVVASDFVKAHAANNAPDTSEALGGGA